MLSFAFVIAEMTPSMTLLRALTPSSSCLRASSFTGSSDSDCDMARSSIRRTSSTGLAVMMNLVYVLADTRRYFCLLSLSVDSVC